ncbi:MAG: 2-hydroxyacyl-CoA dehydratase [Deltaproteobacteria bacterium]|nr:2-hydroxyacyl-CoA dehydratase [Deltaproteobacteria bacterium]
MDILNQFYEISKDPFAYAGSWKNETNGKIVGHFCSYTPEEIIVAAGALPFRIFGSPENVSKSDIHLQAYSCSLVRGALGDALSGRLDFLDGVVFPHTCDSIQRLSDIWRMNITCDFHSDVILPVKLNTKSAREYMVSVIHKFKKDLENRLDVEITTEKLKSAVDHYNKLRSRLQRIYEIRRENPNVIDGSAVHTIVKTSMIMDREVLSEELNQVVKMLESRKRSPASSKKRLIAAGGLCSMPDIYNILEDSGAWVVWDDFCTGSRYFDGKIDTDGDIIESIAKRYLERIVCPAKHSGLYSRGEHILKIVRQSKAQGVIFLYLKFCDPHSFDYPYIKEMLDEEGIPSMLFEVEDQLPSEGQFKTRCEAFIEML